MYSLGSVSSLVSEKKSFEISANQSIVLALAAILNIRLDHPRNIQYCLITFKKLKLLALHEHMGSPPVFSSPGPKVHVNYCHHLASVV
jgi:hypothetical protein